MLLKIITGMVGVLACSLIVLASSGYGIGAIQQMMTIPYGDKWMHIALFGSFSALLGASFGFPQLQYRNKRYPIVSILLAFVMTLEEGSQLFITFRNFEFSDLLCNYVGIFLIAGLAQKIWQPQPRIYLSLSNLHWRKKRVA